MTCVHTQSDRLAIDRTVTLPAIVRLKDLNQLSHLQHN